MASPSGSIDLEIPPSGVEAEQESIERYAGFAVIAVLVAATCWSFIGIAYRLILDEYDVSPITVVALRAATAASVMLTVVAIRPSLRRQLGLAIRPGTRGPLLLAGLISSAGFYIALIYAYEVAGVAVGTVLLYFAPSIVAGGSWLLFRDRITRLQAVALVLSLVGVTAVSGVLAGGEHVRALGVMLGLTSAACYASYSLLGQHLLSRLHPLAVVAFTATIGSIGLWTVKLLAEGASLPSLEAVAWIVGVTGIGTTLVPLVLYTWALSGLGAARASLLTTLEPVFAVALAFMILGETLGPLQLVGGVLVIASVTLAGIERLRR